MGASCDWNPARKGLGAAFTISLPGERRATRVSERDSPPPFRPGNARPAGDSAQGPAARARTRCHSTAVRGGLARGCVGSWRRTSTTRSGPSIRDDDAGPIWSLGDHDAPRIDDHAAASALERRLRCRTGGSDDERTVLDGRARSSTSQWSRPSLGEVGPAPPGRPRARRKLAIELEIAGRSRCSAQASRPFLRPTP